MYAGTSSQNRQYSVPVINSVLVTGSLMIFLLSLFNTVPRHSLKYNSQRLKSVQPRVSLGYKLVKGVDHDRSL